MTMEVFALSPLPHSLPFARAHHTCTYAHTVPPLPLPFLSRYRSDGGRKPFRRPCKCLKVNPSRYFASINVCIHNIFRGLHPDRCNLRPGVAQRELLVSCSDQQCACASDDRDLPALLSSIAQYFHRIFEVVDGNCAGRAARAMDCGLRE